MFPIRFSKIKTTGPLRTIEREMEEARAMYQNYLDTTSDNYMAQRGDVKIKDPHTMVGNAYKEIRNYIDAISRVAKKENKAITFEDGRALTRDDEFVSPVMEEKLGKKVLITVVDKNTGDVKRKLVDGYSKAEIPLMKKISNALGELFTGKKQVNIDKDLEI